MNKKQPYEEALEKQMNNLQPQREDESWQKMKQLLDDNEKHVPFAFFKLYKPAIVLTILLLIGLWLLVSKTNNIQKEKPVATLKKNQNLKQKTYSDKSEKTAQLSSILHNNSAYANSSKTQNTPQKHSNQQLAAVSKPGKIYSRKLTAIQNKKVDFQVSKGFVENNEINRNNMAFNNHGFSDRDNAANANNGNRSSAYSSVKNSSIKSADSLQIILGKNKSNPIESNEITFQNKPSLQTADTSFLQKDTVNKSFAASQIVSLKRKKIYFVSAGVGLQQQVPLAGQKVVSYGYNANENPLTDYIPSLYFRFEKDRKWFLQGEFIYRAPELVKEFAYSRQTLVSDSVGTVTTTSLNLKKTFYHKIPVTFNYYLHPNLSAGAGVMYNLFQGAIAEKEMSTKSTQTPLQSVVKQIVPIAGYTDSFLYKSHLYLLLQTNYNLGRFSAGLRYSKDIQPYIKYTLPDGRVTNKKNWALEFILQFCLWKSAKF